MENSNNLKWAELFAKYLTILVSAIWVLVAGTDLISKESAALDLRNKKLGIQSIPLAKPFMTYEFSNKPWVGDEDLCTITGQYSIENIGELPIVVTNVVFKVYEKSVLKPEDVGNNRIKSFTMSTALNELEPMLVEEIPGGSRVDVGQSIQRSFGFVIKRLPGKLYAVVANAEGGLASVSGGVDAENQFGVNELRYNSGFKTLCGGDQTLPVSTNSP